MNYLKSLLARDRWKVTRLISLKLENGVTICTDIYMMNQYSKKVRKERWRGQWELTDFPGNVFRG